MTKVKVFTSEDRQAILRDLVQTDIEQKKKKEMEKILKEPVFWDNCPYCNELIEYKNDEKARREVIRGKTYLVVTCPKCGKEAYLLIQIVQNGNMISGISYDPDVSIHTKEEVLLLPYEDLPKPHFTVRKYESS